jgi:hypothetical protein
MTLPSTMTVFSTTFILYFLVTSGIIYDFIMEPPSMGSSQDPKTGRVKPVAFLKNRINGQYIIEGLAGGAMICLGGLGFILLDMSNDNNRLKKVRYLLLTCGVICIGVGYNMCLLFMRMKLPMYLLDAK